VIIFFRSLYNTQHHFDTLMISHLMCIQQTEIWTLMDSDTQFF